MGPGVGSLHAQCIHGRLLVTSCLDCEELALLRRVARSYRDAFGVTSTIEALDRNAERRGPGALSYRNTTNR